MGIEALNRIREAEKAAETRIEEARARAAAVAAKAGDEAERTIEKAMRAAEAEAKQVADSIVAAARREAEEIKRQAEAAAERHATTAASRMGRAVDLIVGRVVKGDGRS